MSEQTALKQEVVALEPPSAGVSRRNFFAFSAAACGAAALLTHAQPAQALVLGDERMLRFLEEVERVELAFFNRAALSGTADGLEEKEAYGINGVAKQDNEHVYWFKLAREKFAVGALERQTEPNLPSSMPVPTYKFTGDDFASRKKMFEVAIFLKETAVSAYQGAIVRCQDPTIIQAVAALAGIESRHLALLRSLAGQSPLAAYEKALRPEDVRSRLIKYGFTPEVLR